MHVTIMYYSDAVKQPACKEKNCRYLQTTSAQRVQEHIIILSCLYFRSKYLCPNYFIEISKDLQKY